MLCSAPGCHPAIAEDRYVRHLCQGYEEMALWWDRHGQYYFRSRKDLARFSGMQIRQYLEHVLKRWPGTEHVILKEPWLTAYFPVLARLLDDALFVVVARDPRDIAASLFKVGERLAARGQENPHPRDDPARTGLYIRNAYASLFESPRRLWGGRLAWITYERAVEDPQGVTRQIGRFTGLDLSRYDPEGPWPGWNDGQVEHERLGGSYASELWGKPVTRNTIGSWRETLSPEDARAVLEPCGEIVQMFGYGQDEPET